MTAGQSSGTYAFSLPLSDVVLEAYERCGVRNSPLTTEHMTSARRSLNLVQTRWVSLGVNLWRVNLYTTYMPQGQSVYDVDPSVINVLDVYRRQYLMGSPADVTPDFTTTIGSATVTIAGFSDTPIAGGYISVTVPVSVGGITLQSFYQVVSVPSSSSCTVTAASAATSSVTSGGAVPSFATTAGSTTVTVTLANHGLLAGQAFNVQVETAVGGISLLGAYTVGASPATNTFTITAANVAGSSGTASENGGNAQLATQSVQGGLIQNQAPTDILMYPLSRNDYAALSDKFQQGEPTTYWFNRLIGPTLTVWMVPDGNGPYELRYYACQQLADAEPTMGQTPDMPYAFYEAFCAAVAANLAIKWAPDRAIALGQYADQQWQLAADENREKVALYMRPDFSGYYR